MKRPVDASDLISHGSRVQLPDAALMQNFENWSFDITATACLEDILKVAMSDHHSGAKAWCVTDKGLVLYWYDKSDYIPKEAQKFITPIAYESAAIVVKDWLNSVDYDEWDTKCEFDDIWDVKAFRVHNKGLGPYAICAILPVWGEVGK